MADVRSLLRSEIASRSAAQSGSSGTRVTKKRKIEASDDVTRKKSRPTTPGLDQTPEPADDANIPGPDQNTEVTTAHDSLSDEEAGPTLENEFDDRDKEIDSSSTKLQQKINEDEWAAFEREVVAPTHRAPLPAAAVAAATISAAPVTADELAAEQQKRKEDQSLENEDAEGEREDAARHLEEEFEEMEQLEERVKRLKAKREELRQHVPGEDGLTNATVEAQNTTQQEGYESEEEDEADADADADWDDWRFR
jgi:DNA repair exonuclease SbcCD ATPase subunit